MKCEDLYKEILSIYDKKYIEKNLTTQCSSSSLGNFFVINDHKKKVSLAMFFEKAYQDDERIYAEFVKVERDLAWNLQASEDKVDDEKITKLLIMILKGKHFSKSEKNYFSENMLPLFPGSNFEKMQKKYKVN